jgi:hypothetical protein
VTIIYEFRRLAASLIFDPEDHYAREERSVRGPHPRPIGSVKFLVVAQVVNGARQDLPGPVELVVTRNPSGYHLCFGTVKLQPDSVLRQGALADGVYRVRVESDFYQPLEMDVTLPREHTSYFVDLQPSYAYPFPPTHPFRPEPGQPFDCTDATAPRGRGPTLLRGGIFAHDGQGISGATIQVVGQSNIYMTDESGQWVLWFADTHPTGQVTVQFALPGAGGPVDVPDICVIQGRESSLAQTALRGWVQSDAGLALPGATIVVSGQPGSTTSDRIGNWFYYFNDLNQPATTVNVTVTLPDGRSLTQPNVQVQPRATVVVPTFRFV